jgi:hypothetical protein
MSTFSQGVLTYKSIILTLWTRNRTGNAGAPELSLAPISMDRFRAFFAELFNGDTVIAEERATDIGLWAAEVSDQSETDLPAALQAVLYALIRELEEEYGHVTPENLDPRFIPHFLLEAG